MTKEQAIEQLIQLRWAIDSLPPDCEVLSMTSNAFGTPPRVHVDRDSVYAEADAVCIEPHSSMDVQLTRRVGDVELFCLVPRVDSRSLASVSEGI